MNFLDDITACRWGCSRLTERADATEKKASDLEDRTAKLKSQVAVVEGSLVKVEGRLDLLEPRVGKLEGRNVLAEGEIVSQKEKVHALSARLTEPDGSCAITGLKNGLGAVEGKTATLENEIAVVANKVNEIDALKERLSQEEAKNALLEGRVQELETQQKVSDQNNERRQKEFFEFMQKAAADWQKERESLTQQVKEYSAEMREMHARINKATEETGILHKEVTEEFDNLRKAQTNTRIKRSSLDMKSRRKSTGYFPSQLQNTSYNKGE